MTLSRILVVDDDPDIQRLLRVVLEKAGMSVLCARDGRQALQIWRETRIDLLLVDVMMPDIDGFEVVRRIRRVSEVPIIMLTAKGMEADVLQGFECGVDDYITKPFRPKEVVARINAVLKRHAQPIPRDRRSIAYDSLILDLESHCVRKRDKTIEVSPLEFRLLQYLMHHLDKTLSKEDLLQNVWGYKTAEGDTNFIEAAIRRLRKKLEMDPSHPQYIHTVRGSGYRFGSRKA